MRLTPEQLVQIENILKERGYHKQIMNNSKGYDMHHVFQNETFHWYKTIERVREEDEYGDLVTKQAVILYLAFWDHNLYSNVYIHPFNIGSQALVEIIDSQYYVRFSFPWINEDGNSIFSDISIENNGNLDWRIRNATDKEMNHLIDTLEQLSLASGVFYKQQCTSLLYKNLREKQ